MTDKNVTFVRPSTPIVASRSASMRLLLVLVALAAALEPLPGIAYIGNGYNVLLGNPLGSQDSLLDPGFQVLAIVNLTSLQPWNGNWSIPNGVQVLPAASCDFMSQYTSVTNDTSYVKYLSTFVSLDAEFDDILSAVKFSASYGYSAIQSGIDQQQYAYTEAAALCTSYVAMLQPVGSTSWNITSDFRMAIENLPLSFDPASYRALFSSFGHGYTTLMTMGGRWGQESWLNSTSYSLMQQEGIDIGYAASLSFDFFSGGVSDQTQQEIEYREKFDTLKSGMQMYWIGGSAAPTNDSWEVWASSLPNHPMPFTYTITPISTLLDSAIFPLMSQSNLSAIRAALQQASSCAAQNWSGSNCTAPPTCIPQCQHGQCVDGLCNCESGWQGSDCSVPVCARCQNNGTCNAPNDCSCPRGWTGNDCSQPCSPTCYNRCIACTTKGKVFCVDPAIQPPCPFCTNEPSGCRPIVRSANDCLSFCPACPCSNKPECQLC